MQFHIAILEADANKLEAFFLFASLNW